MAGEFYISNLAGTFDYQEILNLYYQSQIAPVKLLQRQESKISDKVSALNDFESKLNSLYDAFNRLTSATLLEEKKVSVSSPDVLSATVVDPLKAVEGTYQVNVTRLAKNDVWLSQSGVSDLSSAAATSGGQITITYAGQTVAVIDYDTDSADSAKPSTLTEIAKAINDAQDKLKASVIYDGSNYRLLLTGSDTGKDSTISISETGSGDLLDQLQLGDDYSDSHVQTAQDAQIEVYGATITSPTNTFTGAIPGVELTISSTGTSTVEISADYQPFKDALNALINAYNSVVDFINEKAGKDGVLSGDNTLYMIRSGILSRLQPLFNLGLLDVDKDTGHVNIDSEKLDSLIENVPHTLEDALSQLKDSLQDYLLFLVSPDSPVENEIESLNDQKERIGERINELNKMLSEQIEIFKKQLIQVQLLQQQMAELRAKIASTFGQTTLLKQS
ncbi:flagellar filament capping protein FliD [Thermovibrio sp.]